MNIAEAGRMNVNLLAYIGDAVYEVYIREMLISEVKANVDTIHRRAIRFVSAEGQSYAVRKMAQGFLTEEEVKIYKRGRNHRASSRPKNADPRNYKVATGFEALIGYLYLTDQKARLEEVIDEAIRLISEDKNEQGR